MKATRIGISPNPYSATPTLDGYVRTNAHDSRTINPPYNDTNGIRTMGYYDGTDLNYHYSMASQFNTSDRWFSPVMTRTGPNREYLIAANPRREQVWMSMARIPTSIPLTFSGARNTSPRGSTR